MMKRVAYALRTSGIPKLNLKGWSQYQIQLGIAAKAWLRAVVVGKSWTTNGMKPTTTARRAANITNFITTF